MLPTSIIIITLNESKRIGDLLHDLSRQSWQNFEVIVVDSHSDDDTCAIAQGYSDRLPKLTVHKMNNRGVALGRNTGAQLAAHNRLLFLDADVRLSQNFMMKSSQLLDSKRLQVAGVYLSSKGLAKRFAVGYKIFNMGIYGTQFVFPTAIGACLFSTKTIHETIDGFDESISLCEDCDYVKRASKLSKFRMLPLAFCFDPRRLEQDGTMKTGWKYIHANLHRLFIGEIRHQKIQYPFGHYQNPKNPTSSIEHNGNKHELFILSQRSTPLLTSTQTAQKAHSLTDPDIVVNSPLSEN